LNRVSLVVQLVGWLLYWMSYQGRFSYI
jgi:hypothetical protein